MAKRICSVSGCGRSHKARGLCDAHYKQQARGEELRPLAPRWPRGAMCSVEGCETVAYGRGLCSKHYQRWEDWGDPLGSAPRTTALERWWSHVEKNGPIPDYAPHLGPCWIWTGALDRHGYGRFSLWAERRTTGAHRWGYEHLNEPVSSELDLDHLCRVPRCVNPAHLEPVTRQENLRRGDWSGNRGRPLKTHCKRGHEFTPENTARYAGKRQCRTCINERARDRRKT